MYNNFNKITFFCILISFLVNSCSNEDLLTQNNKTITVVNKAKEYFNKNAVELKDNVYFLGTPDWKNASFKNDTLIVSLLSNTALSVKDINN